MKKRTFPISNISLVKRKTITPLNVQTKKRKKLVSILAISTSVTITRKKTVKNSKNDEKAENGENGKNTKNVENDENDKYLETNFV